MTAAELLEILVVGQPIPLSPPAVPEGVIVTNSGSHFGALLEALEPGQFLTLSRQYVGALQYEVANGHTPRTYSYEPGAGSSYKVTRLS